MDEHWFRSSSMGGNNRQTMRRSTCERTVVHTNALIEWEDTDISCTKTARCLLAIPRVPSSPRHTVFNTEFFRHSLNLLNVGRREAQIAAYQNQPHGSSLSIHNLKRL